MILEEPYAELARLREENRMLNWQKEQLEEKVGALRKYLDETWCATKENLDSCLSGGPPKFRYGQLRESVGVMVAIARMFDLLQIHDKQSLEAATYRQRVGYEDPQIQAMREKIGTLQAYVDDVEWFNAALADKDWPVYCIEFIDGKPIGLRLVGVGGGIPPEDMRQGDTLIEAIRSARKGAEQ